MFRLDLGTKLGSFVVVFFIVFALQVAAFSTMYGGRHHSTFELQKLQNKSQESHQVLLNNSVLHFNAYMLRLRWKCKDLIFAHVSPESDSFMETVSTLKFAQCTSTSTVELGATRLNKESREVMHLKEQIENLKKQANKNASCCE
ncbi:hypothetical protein QVD17_09509 [Tagetes erecta]|uniref:Kinesin motor domain-containing protein n=1 Tax=Tagetes erecta TaxID=13708 RepID=A0AAD8L4G9_TARER|nr:hypothetical protein QVD17_09509 [Tagetes erecta]